MLYELCALTPPFDATSQLKLNEKIVKGKFSPLPAPFTAAMQATVEYVYI